MKTHSLSLLSALAGVALLTLSGCEKVDDSTINIGEVAALTGGTATFGQSSNKGTKMAVDEINAAGGLLGKQVKLITEDDQSKQGEAGIVAKKLVSRSKVSALLGEVASGRSLEMAPVAQAGGVPMISPASTNPKVTETGDYIFRVCFIDPFQGTVMSKFALSRGWKKVAILTDTKQDYSVGLTTFFKKHFSENEGQIVIEQNYSSGDKDFRAQLTALRAAAPDAIFASGYYNEVALIALQARELGIEVPLLGGDGWDSPSLLEVGGAALEGCFFSNHFSIEGAPPRVLEFVAEYERLYGAKPDAMAALSYDSAMILFDAIKRAGTVEGAPLRDAIAATKDFPAITGNISLDENRNATKPAVILTIKDGKVVYTETVEP